MSLWLRLWPSYWTAPLSPSCSCHRCLRCQTCCCCCGCGGCVAWCASCWEERGAKRVKLRRTTTATIVGKSLKCGRALCARKEGEAGEQKEQGRGRKRRRRRQRLHLPVVAPPPASPAATTTTAPGIKRRRERRRISCGHKRRSRKWNEEECSARH